MLKRTSKQQQQRAQLLEEHKKIEQEGTRRWQAGLECYRQQNASWVNVSKALTLGMPLGDLRWWSQFVMDEPFNYIFNAIENDGFGVSPTTPASPDGTFDSRRTACVSHFLHAKSVEHMDSPCWFSLSKGLLWGLYNTDLKETYVSHIQMPFPTFFIALPPDCIYLNDYLTGLHEARYIGVSEGYEPTWGRALCIAVFCQPNKKSFALTDDHVMDTWLPLFDEEHPLDYVLDMTEHAGEIMIELSQQRLSQGNREKLSSSEIQAVLVETSRRLQSGEKPDYYNIPHHFGYFFDEEHRNVHDLKRLIQHIVVNTLLYINSVSSYKKQIHEDEIGQLQTRANKAKKGGAMLRARLISRIKELGNVPEWELGTNITIDPKAEFAETPRSGASSPGRKLTKPSITRGHWRHQAHGPRHSLRKLIWIAPFVRGKDLGMPLGHKYDVKP
jgi:hypothetical protein